MTSLVTSIVAIILFGLILVGTMSYGDSLGMMSTVDATNLVQRMQTAAATVAQVQHDTGSRPTSMSELVAAGMPPEVMSTGGTMTMECGDERCSPLQLCLAIPSTGENVMAARAAAARLHGTVSGVCGDPTSAVGGQAVIGLAI